MSLRWYLIPVRRKLAVLRRRLFPPVIAPLHCDMLASAPHDGLVSHYRGWMSDDDVMVTLCTKHAEREKTMGMPLREVH